MIGRFFPQRAPILPRDTGGEPWLAAVIAVLCFLACLSAVGALAADRAAHGWARALGAEATVLIATHDEALARRAGASVLRLEHGRVR
ncbi:MAG TPA: hypothetical protein VGE03_04655, partial [Brevundimonas sp.]